MLVTKSWIALLLIVLSVARASAQSIDLGLGGAAGRLRAPWASSCNADGATGLGPLASVEVRSGAWRVEADYSRLNAVALAYCAIDAVPMSNGTYTYTQYMRGDDTDEDLQTFMLRVGYTPQFARVLIVSAGAGLDTESREPLLAGGLALQSRGVLQVRWGFDLLTLRNAYQIRTFQAQNGIVVSQWSSGRLHDWKAVPRMTLGLHFRITNK